MTAMIRRRRIIDKDIERKIVIGMVVSTNVCNELIPFCFEELFDIATCRLVFKWIKDYYGAYKIAPFKHITDIFDNEKGSLSNEDKTSVEEFLSSLSEQFAGEGINEEYVISNAKIYLRKQSIIKHAAIAQSLAQEGDLSGAEKALAKFNAIPTSTAISWVNPFGDEDYLFNVFRQEDNALYELDGKFGSLIGPMKREWLLGIMGPMKRGKTWMLQHFAISALYAKRRVLFISLEMPDKDLSMRFYKQLVGLPDETGTYYMPVFDCQHNQDNSCERPERTGSEAAPEDGPEDGQTYTPCSYCHNKYPDTYEPAVWGIYEPLSAISSFDLRKRLKALHPQIGANRLRLISYPAFSANIYNITNDIDLLELREGFIPDVIIIDYADILAPENTKLTGREKIDDTWKALKRLASVKKCVVVTGSQTNRDSIERAIIDENHTAEDIRKLAHVDVMITLNQTPREKKTGAMRVSVLEHRWKQFDKFLQAILLQNYSTGQAAIDSEFKRFNPEDHQSRKGKKKE